jgi:hypothetical protein
MIVYDDDLRSPAGGAAGGQELAREGCRVFPLAIVDDDY